MSLIVPPFPRRTAISNLHVPPSAARGGAATAGGLRPPDRLAPGARLRDPGAAAGDGGSADTEAAHGSSPRNQELAFVARSPARAALATIASYTLSYCPTPVTVTAALTASTTPSPSLAPGRSARVRVLPPVFCPTVRVPWGGGVGVGVGGFVPDEGCPGAQPLEWNTARRDHFGSSVSHCVMRSRGICPIGVHGLKGLRRAPGPGAQRSAEAARCPCALAAVPGRGGPGHLRRNGALEAREIRDGDWKSRAGVLRQRLVPQPRQQPRVASDFGMLFRWRVGKARGVDW